LCPCRATRRRPDFGRLLAVEFKRSAKEGDVRVTTVFNRMLGLPGAWVRDVAFGQEAVIVTVALKTKKPICSGCSAHGLPIKEHRTKRWRHLDLGGLRCRIECRLRRLYCPGCGDVYEMVPWGRAGSPYTRDFDDLCAWLAQRMSQTQVTRLMRIGWESVGKILERVVADYLDHGRLDGLVFIGVDEVNYGADHKFLTCVADHETPDRVGHRGPQRRQPAGLLRRAHRRAEGLDQGGLDRHVRRL
jgi:transposase